MIGTIHLICAAALGIYLLCCEVGKGEPLLEIKYLTIIWFSLLWPISLPILLYGIIKQYLLTSKAIKIDKKRHTVKSLIHLLCEFKCIDLTNKAVLFHRGKKKNLW